MHASSGKCLPSGNLPLQKAVGRRGPKRLLLDSWRSVKHPPTPRFVLHPDSFRFLPTLSGDEGKQKQEKPMLKTCKAGRTLETP